MVFIFALGYSFLHRPLGLMMWYQWSYLKEYEQMETKLYQVKSNEKEFLKLYHNFYEKENIDKKSKKIEQELLKYIDNFEIDLLASSQGHDPSAVAFDTISKACAKGFDRVIIDTAGRLQNQKNLGNELEKIVRISSKAMQDAPHRKILVLDGMAKRWSY